MQLGLDTIYVPTLSIYYRASLRDLPPLVRFVEVGL